MRKLVNTGEWKCPGMIRKGYMGIW
jgi:hypothetical protein